MIVSHNEEGRAPVLLNYFCPLAVTHDVIMLFPQTKSGGWIDDDSSDKFYNTNQAVQLLFIKNLIEALKQPIDTSINYAEPVDHDYLLDSHSSA